MMRLTSTFVQKFSKDMVKCVILHPVSFPNKGPIIEQYLAEEALGLAKSLGWTIVRGPFWNQDSSSQPTLDRSKRNTHLYVEANPDQLQDGDYIKTSIGNGTLYKDGIIFDQMESESEGDLYREWQDKILRQSLANSSLVKVKHITKKIFFTKGKLHQIAQFLRKTDFDCLFINSELKPTQVKNLKKFIEARINDVSVSSAYPQRDDFESDTQFETEENSPLLVRRNSSAYRKTNVFDRFSIILQIFAKRTTSKLARLQIELSYLTYIRTRLVREGATYLAALGSFSGDLLANVEAAMEVISAKQRNAGRSLGGEGQSQLELQRRKLRDREAQIRREVEEETRLRKILREKNERRGKINPVVALIGYTNVGKSAFMNALMKKKEVESKDLLFQTLHTTARSVTLPSGTKMSLLDTIGFITNLPVQMIEAFKSTLQEIAHADLVIHLRDCSHPHNDIQKKSVLKILEEMGFGKAFQEERMLEVWNKIDLLVDPPSQHSISCLTGKGLPELFLQIQQKIKKVKGQERRQIQYRIELHGQMLQWLKQNTNHSYNVQAQYNYEPSSTFPSGSVKVYLDLDQPSMAKLMKFLNPNKPKSKSTKGMPPKEGW